MSSSPLPIAAVLAHYPDQYQRLACRELVTTGLSGARLWQLGTASTCFCLRRWPTGQPDRQRLTWMHQVLAHLQRTGGLPVPAPITTTAGETFVAWDDTFWELQPWLPGRPVGRGRLTNARLQTALRHLAELHLALASFDTTPPRLGCSEAIAARQAKIVGLLAGGFQALGAAIAPGVWPTGEAVARRLLALAPLAAPAVARQLATVAKHRVPLLPVLRDVHGEHILFSADRVTGVLDFGAMRVGTCAGDIARLLGSLAGDDQALWQAGLEAYQSQRPLSVAERRLVPAFDHSTVLLSGLHWVDWIYRQRRVFSDWQAVARRMQSWLTRLEYQVLQIQPLENRLASGGECG